MPTFELTSPDGKRYRVEAPDGATEQDALRQLQRQLNGLPVETTKPTPSFSDQAWDFLKSIPGGAVKGFSDTLELITRRPESDVQALLLGKKPEDFQKELQKPITEASQSIRSNLPQPQGRAGRYGETVGEFLGSPTSYIGPGGMAGKALTATTAGLGSEAAGQLTEDSSYEPAARVAGAVVGGMAPQAAVRAITPLPISQQRAGHVAGLRAEGVEPSAGDVTGNRALKYAEASLGGAPGSGGAYGAMRERIGQQYTRAALTRIGENATEATPEVMDRAFTRIGNRFDTLAARNNAPYDRQFVDDVINAVNEYEHLFVDPLRRPMVNQVTEGILNKLSTSGIMDGTEYKAIRSRVERMRRGQAKDPEMNQFLSEVRDALDGLMERSIARSNPRDLGAWQEVRNQYRNALSIEKTMTGAGEQAAAGEITPAKLRQAAVAQSRRNYARGRGDFADLARSGEVILKAPPTSGTSERLHQLGSIGAGAGAALFGGPAEALPAAMAGYIAPGLTGRALLSSPVQTYLKNQLLSNVQGPRGGIWRGLATGAVANMEPREQLRRDAREALTTKRDGYSKEQRDDLRAVSRGTANIDVMMRVKNLLERGYGGLQ